MDRRHFLECGVGAVIGGSIVSNIPKEQTFNFKKVFVLQTDTVGNANGRIYPSEVIEKAVEEFNKNKDSNLGRLGLNGSPINLSEVSHKINNVFLEGNKLYAEITPLNTPMGKVLQQMKNVSFRTSGMGNTETMPDGTMVVKDDFKLISVDVCHAEPETWG